VITSPRPLSFPLHSVDLTRGPVTIHTGLRAHLQPGDLSTLRLRVGLRTQTEGAEGAFKVGVRVRAGMLFGEAQQAVGARVPV